MFLRHFYYQKQPPPPLPIFFFIWLLLTETGKEQQSTGNGDREYEKWEQTKELENRLLRDFCGCPILSQLSMCKKLQLMNCIICFGVKERRVRGSFVFVRVEYSVFRSLFSRGFGI